MIPERAEQGLHDLATDIRNVLRRHESREVTTTEKNGRIINVINNYPTGKSARFSFFSIIGIIFTMILCGIALGVGWTLIINPNIILRWFGI